MTDNEMFGAEAAAILTQVEAADPDMAAVLRGLRKQIASVPPAVRASLAEDFRRLDLEPRLRSMGMPRTLRDAVVQRRDEHGRAIVETLPLRQLRDRVSIGRRLIVLAGGVGTGKTLAACVWLAEQPAGLFAASHRVTALSRNWSGDQADLERVRRVTPLVIDDLGAGVDSPTDKARLEELLCERHAEGLLTIATSNLEPKAALTAYGGRVASRLREVGSVIGCHEVLRARGGKDGEG